MGILLWLGAGAASFGLARIIRPGRSPRFAAELFAALGAAFLFGAIATALDFGGWKEPDWRAGVFAFLGALAAAGVVRGITIRS
jgi:hypothetical protein